MHISLIDDRDSKYREACQGWQERFATRRKDGNGDGDGIATDISFREAMEQARSLDVDLVALTGDIVHFPSKAGVECVAAQVEAVKMPVMFTCGNHDWMFPGLTSCVELRQTWWLALAPLHSGKTACAVKDIGGVRFLAVDN